MKKIISLAIFATILSCKKDNGLENSSSLSNEITEKIFLEKENWKNELVINGDIGPPCTDDYNKWAEDNPNGYYGLPKEINYKVSDFNNDGKEDILLYFPAGSPCNGGNSASSDFSELVYSKDDKYLYNKNLTSKIESLIKEQFNNKTKSYHFSLRIT